MADRDMVIKSIENCLHEKDCDNCSYEGCIHAHGNCIGDLMAHALELLQEQPRQQFFVVDSSGKITPLPIQPQWISVKDRMPAETHSMFFKLYGTPKWRNVMWKEESYNVLVTITFEDGSQFVTSGYTQDGKWTTGISKMLPYTVTHWMPLPEPPKEEHKR